MSEKMKSRKLWLSILAALLPVLGKHFFPSVPTEVIVTSVIGAVAGVLGISVEDYAKQKVKAVEAAALGKSQPPSDQPEA
jgi:F0F1-type ATP synthase assembly protein I